jgi:hypothetical protein
VRDYGGRALFVFFRLHSISARQVAVELCQGFRNRFEDEDESGTTPTMATGLFNHKIRIYFDFVM